MPLKPGKSRKIIAENIREMQTFGHPHEQAVAAALRNADKSGTKHSRRSKMDMKGPMNMHKVMAGAASTGNFGVKSFAEGNSHGGDHPDYTAKTGHKGAMEDSARSTGPGIHHTSAHLPAQAAPKHGPTHPGGYMASHTRRK